MTKVAITTGSRLHFGPLSVAAPAGGRFGGIGVMIESPQLVLFAEDSPSDSILADEPTARRIADTLTRVRQVAPECRFPCAIEIPQMVPAHRGFGSGTQLGLAVARAISAIAHEDTPHLETLARRAGRGLRSAIGLHGFDRGGFLVDGGRCQPDQLGTLISRVEFPATWRFVLASPRQAIGLSGAAEQSTFASQPAMSSHLTGDLCRIVLMDWLPSVINADFAQCSQSMFTFGHAVGEFFSAAQGGVFADARMSEWVGILRRRGIEGIAQTSWGPTLAALCVDQVTASQLQADFANDPGWQDCSFSVTAPLNRGALVSVH